VRGYRQVTITNSRGQVLAYAENITVQTARRGAGTLGLLNVTFAPGVIDRLARSCVRDLVIASQGIPRLGLRLVCLSIDSGEAPVSSGECACNAAIGTFRFAARLRDRQHPGTSGVAPNQDGDGDA